ncbi:MAG: hypothetical protein ABSE62_11230 [Chthoniobacteraceae bacterium]|jgi:hypothetical protein
MGEKNERYEISTHSRVAVGKGIAECGLAAARADLLGAAQKADLSALEQIGDGSGGFTGIAAATGDGEDQVSQGKVGPVGFA